MAPRPDDILTVGVELSAQSALQSMDKFEKALKKKMTNVKKTVEHLGKVNKKFLQETVEDTKDWLDELDDLAVAQDHQVKQLGQLSRQIDALKNKRKTLAGVEKEQNEKSIELLEKQAGLAANQLSAKLMDKATANKMRHNIKEALETGIEGARPVLQSLFSKDLKGFIEEGTKLSGKMLGGAAKFGAMRAGKAAAALGERGAGLKEAGAAKGGMGGAAMGAMGSALKGLGSLAGKFGPILSTVSKLGPLISTISTVLISVVKLFIDAEAGAKEFQKDLLSTASTAEFLGDAGYNAETAFSQLEDAVRGVRNAAFSLDNIKWGITPEETKTVVGTLNQEGMSLRTISQEATRAGKTMQDFTGELVHSSVAYSRAFGVPLQEISAMQAELFTEMGASLKETQMGFSQMVHAANESGIASNKFFAMIRGVSADLSLYNTRLADTVKLLGNLGKVMSPRNAQKFMQGVMGFMKGKSRGDLLRTTLLGGKGSSKALDRDLDRKAKSIGDTIQQASGKAFSKQDLLTKPIDELVDGVAKEQQGTIREAVAELRMDTKASKQGVFGRAMASENVGPAAAYDMMKNSLNIAGTGKLSDRMGDIGTQMLAENQGISQEQLRGMAKFEMALDDQKEALKAGLKDPEKRLKTIAKLQKAGIKADEKSIDAADTSQLFDTMDEGTKEMAKVDAGIQDLGKAQANMMTSLLQKFEVLVNFVMNQLYNVLSDIRDMLGKLPWIGGSDTQKKSRDITRQASASRDKGTMDALQKATDAAGNVNPDAFKKAMVEGSGGLGKSVENAFRHFKESQATGGKEEKAETAKAMGTLTDAIGGAIKSPDQLAKAMKEAGVGEDKVSQVTGAMAGGKSVKGAMSGVLSPDEMMKVYQKSLWFLDPDQLGRIGGELRGSADMVGKIRAQGAKTDDLQMQVYNAAGLGDQAKNIESLKPSGFNQSKEGQELLKDSAASSATTADAVSELNANSKGNTLHVKFSEPFLRGKYKKTVEEAVLDAARKALFEYYMYKDLSPEELTKYMKANNMSIGDMAKKMGEAGVAGQTGEDVMKGGTPADAAPAKAKGNAMGGVVTDVDGGLATVRAAAGEGLASVGRGERIVPAGGGGGGGNGTLNIPINVNGVGGNDLAKIIHAKVIDGIAEYKRRERYT